MTESDDEMYGEPTDVTPLLAAKWLHTVSEENRHKSWRIIRTYAATMGVDEWLFTHQGIALATDGRLLDGQHRLEAVVLSGKTVRMMVWYNCDPATFHAVDTNLRRLPAQFIHQKYGHTIAGAARILASLTLGRAGRGTINSVWDPSITTGTVLAVRKKWADELTAAAGWASAVYTETRISPSIHTAVLAQALKGGFPQRIGPWVDGLISGADLSPGDARLALRSRWLRDFKQLNGQPSRLQAYSFVARAWNGWVTEEKITKLQYATDQTLPKVL